MVVFRKGTVSLVVGPVRATNKRAVLRPRISAIVTDEGAVALKALSVVAAGEGSVVLTRNLSRCAAAEQKKHSECEEKIAYHPSLPVRANLCGL